jgi:hypothetical protein
MMPSISRRHLMIAASGIATAAVSPRIAFAQAAAPAAAGPFKLDPLTYPANALEPHIDARTMEIHHDLHHQAYVSNLNNFAAEHPQIAAMPIADVLGQLDSVPKAIRAGVRNNLGGHANHTMFWQIMGPDGGKADGDVLAAIDRDFGAMAARQRFLGARLLSHLPEPPCRLSQGVVEHGELEGDRRTLRWGQGRHAGCVTRFHFEGPRFPPPQRLSSPAQAGDPVCRGSND